MIIEESERPDGHRMATVRSDRGDEYVIDVDAAIDALAQMVSDHDNERRFGWRLERGWFQQEFVKLRTVAVSSTPRGGEA